MKTVLLLGAGGAAANSVARCLTRSEGFRVIGANADPYDLQLADVNDRRQVPYVHEEGWRDAILTLIDELSPDFVHAQPEAEVLALADLREDVEYVPGEDLMVDRDVIRVAHNKWISYVRWREAGVPVPKTWYVHSYADLVDAWEATGGDIWLRRASGAGGAGSLLPATLREADMWIERADGWGSFTAAEVLTPETTVVQQLWRDGAVVASQTKRRLRWANARNVPSGIGGSAAISETISDPDAFLTACAAVRALNEAPHGIFSADMARNRDGVLCMTEVNVGRFNTTVDFLASAGLNLPALHFGYGEMQPVDPLEDGLLWIRGMDRPPVFTSRALMERENTPLEVAA